MATSTSARPPDSPARDRGVRLITAYKFTKGGLGVVGSIALMVGLATGRTISPEIVDAHLEHHLAGAWSVSLAQELTSALQPRHLWLVAFALGLDGIFTLLEGWALHHGHWWGPWLVVVATSSFLPFEVAALIRHVHLGRAVILGLNLAIVAYLVHRAIGDHLRRPQTGEAGPLPVREQER